jgi:hypothetical protein
MIVIKKLFIFNIILRVYYFIEELLKTKKLFIYFIISFKY